MHSDSFGSRPGFRYIPDPLGRLNKGHFVRQRDLHDPFGRLMAEPKPEPEISNFRNPLRIRDSVGMEGLNSRRDVAKVENLLGQAGALDLAKTDGVTGFFGARADEAVRKFQKDRGLKVDGLINPNGPTFRTLIAGGGQRGNSAGLPGRTPGIAPKQENPLSPFSEQPTPDPRRETVKRLVRRLLEMQKAGIDPRAQLLARQLARAGTDGGDGEKGGEGQKPPSSPKPGPDAETPEKPEPPKQATGPKDGKDRDEVILGRLQEIIDALKDQTDPQAGDIDTAGSGEDGPVPGKRQAGKDDGPRSPGPSDETDRKGKIDELVDRFRDLLEAQLKSDAKMEIQKGLTKERPRMKKAKQPPKKPDRPIRRSRPSGPGGGFIIPRKNVRDPFEFLDFFNNLLK